MSLFSKLDSPVETVKNSALPTAKTGFHKAKRNMVLAAFTMAFTMALAMTPTESVAEIHEDALFEVSIGGGFSLSSGDFSNYFDTLGATSGVGIHLSGGYFVTELMSVGLALEYDQFSLEDNTAGSHYRLYSLKSYLKYHFGYEAKATPYVRLQAGIVFPNIATPLENAGFGLHSISYDPELDISIAVGARVSTAEWGGMYLELAYRLAKIKDSEGEFNNFDYALPGDAPMIQIKLGFSFDIGPKR